MEIRNLDAGRVELSVIDDGVGISQEPSPGRPKSLGMHLVRTLANQLGSELSICSEPGQGTCFRVAFAIEDEKEDHEPALAATH